MCHHNTVASKKKLAIPKRRRPIATTTSWNWRETVTERQTSPVVSKKNKHLILSQFNVVDSQEFSVIFRPAKKLGKKREKGERRNNRKKNRLSGAFYKRWNRYPKNDKIKNNFDFIQSMCPEKRLVFSQHESFSTCKARPAEQSFGRASLSTVSTFPKILFFPLRCCCLLPRRRLGVRELTNWIASLLSL